MDKWEELTHRVQQGFLAQEPDAVMSATISLIAEFGRTLELISADLDRLATAAEVRHGATPTESVPPPALDL